MNLFNNFFLILSYIFVFGGTSGILGIFLAPVQFLKTIKQERPSLSYANIFYFYKNKGGFSIFFRGALPYALMQFFSSAAFGISEFIFHEVLSQFIHLGCIMSIFSRAILGTFFETMMTIKSEISEIVKNKKEFVEADTKILTILLAILIRNFLFWFGVVISCHLASSCQMSNIEHSLYSFLSGLLFAIISGPFDVAVTQGCGSTADIGVLSRLKYNIRTFGFSSVFAGMSLRIAQIIAYTIIIEITARFYY